jgi:hypothetical protein
VAGWVLIGPAPICTAGLAGALRGRRHAAAAWLLVELAAAAVGGYLGLEMLSHLHANRVTPGALFDAARPAAVMIDAFRRK